MIQISTDDVQHLATLSALALGDDEIESLRADLAHILSYVHKLAQLDTTDVEPTYQVTGLVNVWREDIVEPSEVTSQQLINLAPQHTATAIKVPKVL